ncbi:Hypothetical protein, putative [Bodo saltans]|uniref:Uncharacterized protein n=1 Tax=Bodo saltans TaxID=75058 RepID=A0A0S4IS25_BODSA|nr:Hypothetical protein, putative [Bodo saltans]|eukprot:CUF17861.1 Hypothetical protein, putative [Bodo saltans]
MLWTRKHMIRRFVFTRSASHTRTFVFADVKLTSLLPTGPVDGGLYPTSVNDFIKQHKLTIPPIENDLTLTAWAALSVERKQTLMPADSDFFDGHPKLHQATMISRSQAIEDESDAKIFAHNKIALTELKLLGIETLGQFSQITTAQLSTLDIGVLTLVNQTVRPLQDFFDPIVNAFKERVYASNNSTATERKPYAAHLRVKNLTHRHLYSDKKHMLGKDHQTTLESILSSSFGPCDDANVRNPINYVIGAPRLGKSLMLAEVLDHAASQGHNSCGVGIVFSGGTTLPWGDISSVGKATSAFWGRVAYSLYLAIVPEPTLFYGSFEALPFFSSIDCDVVQSLAQKLALGRVVIAADDMWKFTRVMKASLSERDQQDYQQHGVAAPETSDLQVQREHTNADAAKETRHDSSATVCCRMRGHMLVAHDYPPQALWVLKHRRISIGSHEEVATVPIKKCLGNIADRRSRCRIAMMMQSSIGTTWKHTGRKLRRTKLMHELLVGTSRCVFPMGQVGKIRSLTDGRPPQTSFPLNSALFSTPEATQLLITQHMKTLQFNVPLTLLLLDASRSDVDETHLGENTIGYHRMPLLRLYLHNTAPALHVLRPEHLTSSSHISQGYFPMDSKCFK